MQVARFLWALPLCATFVCTAGCGRSKQPLPPARGEGAAPLPQLPSIGVSEQATSVSTSEGRTTGTTYPRAEAQVGPNASGVIAKVMVKEGDRVRKGSVLFKQDTEASALRLAQAEAALEAARVQLRATETEHKRSKTMFDKGAASQMQWDQVQSQFDSAQVGVQQAEVAVNIARKALTDLTVRSPIDGVIASKLKSDGEMATTTPPTIVVVVQNQSFLDLRFRLPERALGRTRVGDEVTATFDALGITQKARITRVLPAVDARTRTIEAVAEIANRDGALKSGLLATVDLAARQEIPERAAEVSRKKTAAKPEPPILESAR